MSNTPQQRLIDLPSCELLVLEVPEGATFQHLDYGFAAPGGKRQWRVGFDNEQSIYITQKYERLEILGPSTADKCSEEDAKRVVEIKEGCSESDWYKYRDYGGEDFWPLSLATNSLISLLQANGYRELDKLVVLVKYKV